MSISAVDSKSGSTRATVLTVCANDGAERFQDLHDICYVPEWNACIITDNHCLRKYDIKTDMITTFAGKPGVKGNTDGRSTDATFACPWGVCYDRSSDSIFVVDTKNSAIRGIKDGIVTTIAGSGHSGWKDGIGREAEFYCPYGIAVNKSGVLFVCDSMNCRIRKCERRKQSGMSTLR